MRTCAIKVRILNLSNTGEISSSRSGNLILKTLGENQAIHNAGRKSCELTGRTFDHAKAEKEWQNYENVGVLESLELQS